VRGYFGGVVPTLSFPRSTGTSLVFGTLLCGRVVVVTPLESVVTEPPFGGS
jgi:hypothetical protein